MHLFILLAWRNLFRNKRRTILSGLAIGIGLAALIVYDALMIGIKENMVRSATDFFPGEAQIHLEGFRTTFESESLINNSREILDNLQKEKIVKSFAPRTMSFAMATSPSDVASVMLYGVDPQKELELSEIKEVMTEGKYLDALDEDKVVIGKKMAKNLGVEVGDRIVITVAQVKTGELSQEMFRVGGIFSFGINQMDSGVAFIKLNRARKLLNIGEGIHEIALKFYDIGSAENQGLSFWKEYSKYGNETVGWNILFKELDSLIKMMRFSLVLSAFLLFSIVALGIVNTLFMSLYERMFEFGVLRAIGTRPSRMAFMVVLEACSLAIISIIIGMLLGYAVTFVMSKVGIDYRGYEFNKVTIKDMLYPVIKTYQYIVYPMLLFIFTAIVGLYPALYAAKLTPAKAMRKSL